MAGHSHAKNVKRRKDAVNKKKAAAFARVSRLIISAVREGGKDPKGNPTLRTAIEKAKEADMPKENVERAIKRGAGEGDEGKLEPFLFECYGPENTAFLIQGATDNRNRTLGEIKEIIKDHNGKMAEIGAVKWLFTAKGIIETEATLNEEQTLLVIEAGAEDIIQNENTTIYTTTNNIEQVKQTLLQNNIPISSAAPGWKANTPLNIKNKKAENLKEALEDNEAVENVFTNL